jgi:hypothetical protein
MKKLKYLVIILIGLTCKNEVFGQDPTFTQFYANPLYLNPAFAGTNRCARFGLNYRNEWPRLSANYVTYSASYDQYFKNISGGFGVGNTEIKWEISQAGRDYIQAIIDAEIRMAEEEEARQITEKVADDLMNNAQQ